MTQDRFLKLLDNPDLLATISYEELKTLALAYPYAHNLRYLLAIKAGQDDHPDFSRNLAAAAAYSLDRKRLFALMVPIQLMPKSVMEEAEQILELKPIAVIQRELEARSPIERENGVEVDVSKNQAITPDEHSENQAQQKGIPVFDLTDFGAQESATAKPETLEQQADEPDQVTTSSVNDNRTSGERFSSFSDWVTQFNPPALEAKKVVKQVTSVSKKAELSKTGPEDTTTPEPTSPQSLAERSVQENKAILSETLAKLYVNQGFLDKAVDMYQRLSLAFPDKSAYFAAEIEKLKR